MYRDISLFEFVFFVFYRLFYQYIIAGFVRFRRKFFIEIRSIAFYLFFDYVIAKCGKIPVKYYGETGQNDKVDKNCQRYNARIFQ